MNSENAGNFLNNYGYELPSAYVPSDYVEEMSGLATINPNAKTPIGREYVVTGDQCKGEECDLEIASMAAPFFTAVGFCLFWYFVAPLVVGHRVKRKKSKKKR